MSPADDGALAEAADERTIRAVFDDWRVVATEEEHMVIGADGQIRDVMMDKALPTLLPALHKGVAVCASSDVDRTRNAIACAVSLNSNGSFHSAGSTFAAR